MPDPPFRRNPARHMPAVTCPLPLAPEPSRATAMPVTLPSQAPHHGTKTPRQHSTTSSPLLRRPEHLPPPIRCLLHLPAACCPHDQSDGGWNAYSKTICIKTFGKTIAYSPPNGHIARHQMYGFGRCILP